ncbi:MAG TPA: AAA family ATPase [Ktedonobacteraceae bacterium]|nr:AAA family ATPase [Ktedonobacteraceae bacterium]
MDTKANEIHNQIFDFDQFASSTQAVIRLAQQEAIMMNAPEVYPEHLFLGALRQDDVEVTIVLKDIGLDRQKIQAQATEILGNLNYESSQTHLLFSRESLACFEWAVSFATQMNSYLIFPKHLILSVLRDPRVQPLLILLLPTQDQDMLPAPLMEAEGHSYTSYIDQLIHSRVREQSITKFKDSSLKQRVFRWFERPHTTFGDIQGLDRAKDELREVVDFLRKPQNFQQSKRTYLYGALIVGHPCTDRTLLLKAIAGEAVVPLICLSLSALVEMLTDLNLDVVSLDDLDLPMDEYELLANNDLSQRGRNMIAHIFSQAKKLSPCVLFFDDLDAVDRLPTSQEREQLLKQLVIEMDGLDNHPPMAVIASTNHIYQLDQALLHPGRFEHQVVMSSSFMTHPAAQTKLCLACKYENLATWKYCVYCGALLAQTCPNCGTLFMQLEGARFCSECGTSQRNT